MKITLKTLHTFGLLFAITSSGQAATITKTTITQTSVTPTSAPAGGMFKFSATLDAPLETGNKVKIDLGKGLASMTGTKTSYSLSRAIFTTGNQNYKIGIYNAKNVLQGVQSNGTYSVTSAIAPVEVPVNHAPTLESSIKGDAIKNATYNVTLKASDADGNLKTITMNWGDNSTPEKLAAKDGIELIFKHAYKKSGTFSLTAYSTDEQNSSSEKKSVADSIEVQSSSKYSKVCNSGAVAGEEDCPIEPAFGNAQTNWGCTRDNETGVIWEIKTDDGGLRDKDWRYSWYEPDAKINGGFAGTPNSSYYNNSYICTGSECDIYAYKNAVNQKGLCGSTDWRVPTVDELKGLVRKGVSPTINVAYFPNIDSGVYWSSSPHDYGNSFAWYVGFGSGSGSFIAKYDYNYVRLVRSVQ
jgi:hypothetical protein